ncbi:MAG TPA: GvpL/GvpF family gas vesicle protein [Gemmatimonadaceae bacterium]|nr:GvpL/GvpF family gas vesicle protein [Gemmatimonadaceae bacterium]
MSEQVVYVYGVVDAHTDASAAPSGVEDARVTVERRGEVAALVSVLDRAAYDSDVVASRAGDMAWVAPRAIAHDIVLSWAASAGAVVPLPMLTLFRDAEGVRAMLTERAGELRALLDWLAPAQEFGLRVFRLDAALQQHVGELSPAIAGLEQQAAQARPGQRYLLERKLEAERAAEVRHVAATTAATIFSTLETHAMEGCRETLPAREPRGAAAEGVAVLNASYLVRRDALEPFRAALAALAEQYEPVGFRFDFTGPWPPYHFVGKAQ